MITEICAKSILRKYKKIESWFMTHYGMNLYRGCIHNCVYCDGRYEKYYVEGEFGRDIAVKINAIELLAKELDPARKRKPMPKSFMMLGGGVCDAYQPVEKKYCLARQTLELIEKYNYPVHILTKSTLIERDMDILKRIDNQNKAMVSFSFSSMDSDICSIFEPGVPGPEEKLEMIGKLKKAGISCGMFLMPVIPFITDSLEMIGQSLEKAKEAGIDFVIFGTMTLKEGRQKDYFIRVLKEHFPELAAKYENIYPENHKWGEVSYEYNRSINSIFDKYASKYKIPKRIPPAIYSNILSKSDLIIVILEHLDYLLKLKGKKSSYGYAAYVISKLGVPIEELKTDLTKIKGIGRAAAEIIREVLKTGTCRQYEDLISY